MTTVGDELRELRIMKELQRRSAKSSQAKILIGKLEEITRETGILLNRFSDTFQEYTLHEKTHSANMLKIMGKIIPEETLKNMNELELTILVLSAFLHDIGMVVPRRERKGILQSKEFDDFKSGHPRIVKSLEEARKKGAHRIVTELEDQLLTYFLRESHASRGAQFIKHKFGACLKLNDLDFSELVCKICASHNEPWENLGARGRAHGYPLLEEYPTSYLIGICEVNVQFLAIILRLADILDFDRERAPSAIFEYLYPVGEVSLSHWLTHFSIQGWSIDKDKIKFKAECEHPLYQNSVCEYFDKIDAELQGAHLLIERFPTKIAEKYRMQLPAVVDRSEVGPKIVNGKPTYIYTDFHFGLDYDRIVALLSEEVHYDETIAIRELLQNSLDAVKYRQALETALGSDWKQDNAKIAFAYDNAKDMLVIDDNGIGMDEEIVEKYFLRIGCSYYDKDNPRYLRDIALLEKQGVALNLISKFGIGILSTFLISDQIEVETRRKEHGRLNIPLSIRINPRLKIYVMKELEPSEWPKGDEPGTIITLHLTKPLDLKSLLERFAINVGLNISVRIDDKDYLIKPKGFGLECFPHLSKKVEYHIQKEQLVRHEVDLSQSGIPSVEGITTFFFPCVKGKLLMPGYDNFDYSSLEMDAEFLGLNPHLTKGEVLSGTKITSEGILVERHDDVGLPFPQISVINFSGDAKPELTLDRKSFKHGYLGSLYIEERFHDFLSSEFTKAIKEGVLNFLTPFWKYPWNVDSDLLDFLLKDVKFRDDMFSFPLLLRERQEWFTLRQIREQFPNGIFIVFRRHLGTANYRDFPDFYGNYSSCPRHFPLVGVQPTYDYEAGSFWRFLIIHSSLTLIKNENHYYLRMKLGESVNPLYRKPFGSIGSNTPIFAQYEGFPETAIYSQNFALACNEKHPLIQVYLKCAQNARSKEDETLLSVFSSYILSRSLTIRGEESVDVGDLGRKLLKQRMITKSKMKFFKSSLALCTENKEISHLFSDPEPPLVKPEETH